MAWQNLSVQFPPAALALSDAVAGAISAGDSEISNSVQRLAAVAPSYATNPTAGSAAGAAGTADSLAALLDAACHLLVVHPYQEGVGQGTSYSRHLSAPNAQHALAAKLGDSWDTHAPGGSLEAVALLIAEQTLQAFADGLQLLTAVLPLPELLLAERRARQLLRLEAEKSVLPGAPQGGNWRPRRLTQLSPPRRAGALIGAEVASAYGYALENTDAKTELENLAQKKQAYLAQVQADLDNFAAQFTYAGGGYCMAASGSAREIGNQLLATEPYAHDHVFSAAVLLVAPPGELDFLKEMLGL